MYLIFSGLVGHGLRLKFPDVSPVPVAGILRGSADASEVLEVSSCVCIYTVIDITALMTTWAIVVRVDISELLRSWVNIAVLTSQMV
jgi:hypothetical protein